MLLFLNTSQISRTEFTSKRTITVIFVIPISNLGKKVVSNRLSILKKINLVIAMIPNCSKNIQKIFFLKNFNYLNCPKSYKNLLECKPNSDIFKTPTSLSKMLSNVYYKLKDFLKIGVKVITLFCHCEITITVE